MRIIFMWISASLVSFILVSFVCILTVFPFNALDEVLLNKILPNIYIESVHIKNTRYNTERYFDFLEQKIDGLNSQGKLVKQHLVRFNPDEFDDFGDNTKPKIKKQHFIKFDPFNFDESMFADSNASIDFVASGTLRDFYGLPLLPIKGDEFDEDHVKLRIPGGNSLFSPGLAFRLKQVKTKENLIIKCEPKVRQIIEAKKSNCFLACICISIIFSTMYCKRAIKRKKWSSFFETVLVTVVVFLFFMSFLGDGTRGGSIRVTCDSRRISKGKLHTLKTKTKIYLKELQNRGEISDNDYKKLILAINTRGYKIPDCFTRSVIVGSYGRKCFGAPLIRMNFTDLEQLN